jgi:LPS-assembly protein
VVDNFIFEIKDNLLKVKNLELTDINGNRLKTELAYINTNSKKLFGKDVYLELDNFSNDKKNEPRLKGRSILNNDRYSEITKGVFTTCKKTDDCPPWEFSSDKITYDKKNEIIKYKDQF